MADLVGSLRTEVVESEKVRMDFLKWKIILIAALAVVGFGIGKEPGTAFPVILGFIPIVCAYVDVVCIHNDLRILVIASFLQRRGAASSAYEDIKAYEDICSKNRSSFFLESFVLFGTTLTMSVLVYSLAYWPTAWRLLPSGQMATLPFAVRAFMAVGAGIGVSVTLFGLGFKSWRLRELASGAQPRVEPVSLANVEVHVPAGDSLIPPRPAGPSATT